MVTAWPDPHRIKYLIQNGFGLYWKGEGRMYDAYPWTRDPARAQVWSDAYTPTSIVRGWTMTVFKDERGKPLNADGLPLKKGEPEVLVCLLRHMWRNDGGKRVDYVIDGSAMLSGIRASSCRVLARRFDEMEVELPWNSLPENN